MSTTASAVAAGMAATGNGVDDLNVKCTTSTSANGVGLTIDVLGVVTAATQSVVVINNPGRGYVAGEILTWSALALPNNGGTVTLNYSCC